jgi:hypothetical protein
MSLASIQAREHADRFAKYESSWTLWLHIEPYRPHDAEEGIAAMRAVYVALSDQLISEWQREALSCDDPELSLEALGAPIGRGLLVRRGHYDSAGNPRDGFPRDLHVSTAGLPSLYIRVRFTNDSPLYRCSDGWGLDQWLQFSIGSSGAREPIRRAIVDAFAQLGYVEGTPR